MKKKLIALAVAGAMTAPMAVMADMSLSGGLQTQIVSEGGDGALRNGLYMSHGGGSTGANSGSFGDLTVKASEDLGNGMKAIAKYGFNIGTDAGIGTREAYVGLAGDFGAVLAGRINHPYKTATVSWDPFLSTFMQARTAGGMHSALYGSEVSNTLAYAGNFGGVKVVAGVIMDESDDATDVEKTNGKHSYAASVNMPVGPVEVALAYASLSENGSMGLGGVEKATAAKVGVKYSAGDFTVAGQYESTGEGLGADKGNVMFVTGTYKMGANSISASVGRTSDDVTGGENNNYMAVGFNHAFSAKTNVYVGYRSSRDVGGVDGVDSNAFGAGMRMKF